MKDSIQNTYSRDQRVDNNFNNTLLSIFHNGKYTKK